MSEVNIDFSHDEDLTKVKGMSIKLKILGTALIPLLLLGIVTLITSTGNLRTSLQQEALDGLRTSTQAMEAAYSAISGGDYEKKGEILYKGNFNVTNNVTFIDDFTGANDTEVTVIFGDTRCATSLKKEDGSRNIGTQISAEVYQKLQNGEEVSSTSLDINGTNFYAYYIPIRNSDGSIVGSYFAGKPSTDIDSTINKQIVIMVIITIVILVVAAVFIFIVSTSIATVISEVQRLVTDVAHGDLDVHIPDRHQQRKDEIGLMALSLQRLVDALHHVIADIVHSADEVEDDAEKMTDMIQQTTNNSTEISHSVDNISQGAVSQAEDIETATGNINDMGMAIAEIVDKVEQLTDTSNNIDKARGEAETIINELAESSDRTIEAVDVIGKQVKLTDESVSKISEAIVMITSIAEETNLLSLNASIEAARAGEAGKGFAVVASEIQKLAEESSNSADTIAKIIENLSKESKNTVEAMNSVQEIINVQQEKLSETREKFNGVGAGIKESLVEIGDIQRDTKECDEARKHVTDIIQNLSAVSEQNAAETEETMASMEELSSTMQSLTERADDLKRLAEELDSEVHYFSFEHHSGIVVGGGKSE